MTTVENEKDAFDLFDERFTAAISLVRAKESLERHIVVLNMFLRELNMKDPLIRTCEVCGRSGATFQWAPELTKLEFETP